TFIQSSTTINQVTSVTVGSNLNMVDNGANPSGGRQITLQGTGVTVSDGTTTVANVNEIDVDGSTLSVTNNGNGKVTITPIGLSTTRLVCDNGIYRSWIFKNGILLAINP